MNLIIFYFAKDIKKIFNISLVFRDKTPLIKVRNKNLASIIFY